MTMNYGEAEAVALRLVEAGYAARSYPSDREDYGHMVIASFGPQRYRVYEPGAVPAALAAFARGEFSDQEPTEGRWINGTQEPR